VVEPADARAATIRKRFIKEQPLKGVRWAWSARDQRDSDLALTLRDGGADLVLCASIAFDAR